MNIETKQKYGVVYGCSMKNKYIICLRIMSLCKITLIPFDNVDKLYIYSTIIKLLKIIFKMYFIIIIKVFFSPHSIDVDSKVVFCQTGY